MDWATLVAALVTSAGTALAAAKWMGQEIIKNRLQRDLENHKTALTKELETYKLALNKDLEQAKSEFQLTLARDKAVMDGAVRKEVETQLGESAAQRQYELEARRRLYLAVGPLRSQLLLACRDTTGRIEAMGFGEHYRTDLAGYYGRSTVYRILRPMVIGELIEEQLGLADFLVDPAVVDCVRFRRTLRRILSGDELVCGHPDTNWKRQEQHVYADSLSSCSDALIDRTDGARVLRFNQFNSLIETKGENVVAPFDTLLRDFKPKTKPILWVRLVAYANACNELVRRLGGTSFETKEFPVEELLKGTADPYVVAHLQNYQDAIDGIKLAPL